MLNTPVSYAVVNYRGNFATKKYNMIAGVCTRKYRLNFCSHVLYELLIYYVTEKRSSQWFDFRKLNPQIIIFSESDLVYSCKVLLLLHLLEVEGTHHDLRHELRFLIFSEALFHLLSLINS